VEGFWLVAEVLVAGRLTFGEREEIARRRECKEGCRAMSRALDAG
jgi:hypothetical protein